MNSGDPAAAAVSAVEAIMLEKFRSEPFHNLHLLHGEQSQTVVPGGTCSDKTLSFLRAAEQAGFEVGLHSAYIGGQEIHRLARVHIRDGVFFADVGNGWPSLRLYPADREIAFRCFGMGFRTKIEDERLTVFHERQGRESLQIEVDARVRPERDIRADIERRFSSGVVYPFSNSVRFSLVVGSRFLFLRGDRLQIYENDSFREVGGIERADVPAVLLQYFGFDVGPLLASLIQRAPD